MIEREEFLVARARFELTTFGLGVQNPVDCKRL